MVSKPKLRYINSNQHWEFLIRKFFSQDSKKFIEGFRLHWRPPEEFYFKFYWRALYIFIIYGLSRLQCDLISTRGIQISIQGVIFPLGDLDIHLGGYISTGGIQISIQGVIFQLEGFRYPFKGLYFHWGDLNIHLGGYISTGGI